MTRVVAAMSLVGCLCLAWPAAAADKPLVVDVWPAGKVPEEAGDIGAEKSLMSPKLDRKQVEVTEPTRMVTNVSRPTLTVYRPAKAKDTGTAVLICPGGGYWNLYWELEGEDVAAWLNSLGVTGVVLKYRVPRRPEHPKHPLQDAQRAVSLVRARAKEWGIDANRVGMLGFSAGGHLTAVTETNFDRRAYESVDDADRVSCRPDFAVVIYPGGVVARDTGQLTPDVRVTKETPPTFIAQAGDDRVGVENSVLLYLALKKAGVPAELHVYATGGHGFGLRPSKNPASQWPKRCEEWLRSQKLLGPITGQ